MSQKIAAAMPVRAADKQAPAQYIRYELEVQQFQLCVRRKVSKDSRIVLNVSSNTYINIVYSRIEGRDEKCSNL